MATKKTDNNNSVNKGSLIYDESIVKGIVSIAVSAVEGVVLPAPKKGARTAARDNIKITSEKDGIYVNVTVSVVYGYNVPDVAYNIQSSVKQNVETMTKYKISKVDVFVSDVVFDEKRIAENNADNQE